jgi:methyl-accepting chemotaxis protein
VAGEVRSLAQRSASAAREIKELIGVSLAYVDTGTRLVGDAGGTMREIVTSVQHVSDIIGEVTAASTEQSGQIHKVNDAIAELDRATQQNAALVEQGAAAAASLKDQAERLTRLVATFDLGSGTAKVKGESSLPVQSLTELIEQGTVRSSSSKTELDEGTVEA